MKLERVKGGGRVGIDDGSIVCKDSVLDKFSQALDGADVWQSDLKCSSVQNAKVRRSNLRDSIVKGGEVAFSNLHRTQMADGIVLGAFVAGSTIRGGQIMGGEVLFSVVADDAVIEGKKTVLDGVAITKRMRINKGVWCRSPRYFDFKFAGIDVGITEGKNGTALIGCREQRMSDWIKKKSLWLKAIGWTDEAGRIIEAEFQKWLDEPIPTI